MNEIIDYLNLFDPILAAFYATLVTWGLTALGASLVFFFKTMIVPTGCMLGFTGGASW